ncbi:hypothetical protein BH18GEM1_BH18GEM1_06590 [soil metagenome]
MPVGSGLIASFPFRRLSDARLSKNGEVGTLTIYYRDQ